MQGSFSAVGSSDFVSFNKPFVFSLSNADGSFAEIAGLEVVVRVRTPEGGTFPLSGPNGPVFSQPGSYEVTPRTEGCKYQVVCVALPESVVVNFALF